MNRIYKVFVSSTFRYIGPARKAVIAGISKTGNIPVSLDSFAPENAADVDVIKRELTDSHIYVLILGPTYGQRPKGQKSSVGFTELEYDRAVKAGKEMLIFTLPWDSVMKWRRENLDPTKDQKEIANEKNLKRFYNKIRRKGHFRNEWNMNDIADLKEQIILSLAPLAGRKDPPPPRGLVQELDIQQSEFLKASRNEFVADIVNSISNYEKLYMRTTENQHLKAKAAEYFSFRFKRHMRSDRLRGIFFESGSSIAFVAKEMAEDIQKHVRVGANGQPTKDILTNNVLVYLTLWLNRGVPCYHFPWGGPEDTYGATYGPISSVGECDPAYDGRPMGKDADDAIASLTESPMALSKRSISLIVTAASGLQLSDKFTFFSDAKFEPRAEIKEQVRANCSGPHVGSFKNKVFKRYLYQSHIPTVLLVDSSKIDRDIDTRHCHFIFDTANDWRTVLADNPFALCISCLSERLDDTRSLLRNTLNWCKIEDSGGGDKYATLIAWNSAFDDAFAG